MLVLDQVAKVKGVKNEKGEVMPLSEEKKRLNYNLLVQALCIDKGYGKKHEKKSKHIQICRFKMREARLPAPSFQLLHDFEGFVHLRTGGSFVHFRFHHHRNRDRSL